MPFGNTGLAKVAVPCSADIPHYYGMVNQSLVLRINPAEMRDGVLTILCSEIANCGNRQTVSIHPKRPTRPTTNEQKMKDKMPTLRKIKRAASRNTGQRFCSTFNFAQLHPKPTHHPTSGQVTI
jgi:hypothetical protein